MTAESTDRVDSASRVIRASPQSIYDAYMDPETLALWLPPSGMSARIERFEPRAGGEFRIVLTYYETESSTAGKSSRCSDVVRGRFGELIPNRQIVQFVEFESDNPAFAGCMKMTWFFTPIFEGTNVMILAQDVPEGIRPEDHAAGFHSTLENLARFVER